MRRREFITLFGAASAWPLAARGQQPAMPVIGFLQPGSPANSGHYRAAFLQGVQENGYVEGENVSIESRWGEGRYERLPQFAADLVNRRVAVLAAGGPPATLAAKSATSTIPIVFIVGNDPVKEGLVASLNHPGGNLTGVALFTAAAMWNKRLELLHVLMPKAASAAILVNPQDVMDPDLTEMMRAGQTLGVQLSFLTVTTEADIEAAFAAAAARRIEALLISDKPFFTVRHNRS